MINTSSFRPHYEIKTELKKIKMMKRRYLCLQCCLLTLGITLASLGVLLLFSFQPLYDFIMRSAMDFKDGSAAQKAWQINDPPLNMDIYLFNWTNPEEVYTPGTKPSFQRVGPYRFLEIREKINVSWNLDMKTINYQHKKLYFYDPENSVRPLDDVINMVHPVPLTIGYKYRFSGYFEKLPISFGLSKFSQLHVTHTVGDVLFNGFEDNILGALSAIPFLDVPDKFGLFYNRNDSSGYDGTYSMHYDTDENFGKIDTWNNAKQSDFWSGHCNDVRGSAGEFYPFYRTKDNITFFSPELCRYAELEYEKEVDVKGILGYKYTARYIFDNGTTRPQNKCFCSGDCIPSGVFNVSSCRENAPMFLSFPHFYGADSYYTDNIEGVMPDEERDEMYIVLEPNTGIVIEVAARMQLNMLLQPISDISLYEDVPKKVFLPVFYMDQKVVIYDNIALGIKIFQNLPSIAQKSGFVMVILGGSIILWVLFRLFFCRKSDKKGSNLYKNKTIIMEEMPLQGHVENDRIIKK